FDWDLTAGTGQPAPATDGTATDKPLALGYDSTGLAIHWADGVQKIAPRDLRLSCRCAACRDEVSGKQLLNPDSVRADVVPTRIWSVGNYALGVTFSDGHSSGIYTYPALREIESAEIEDV